MHMTSSEAAWTTRVLIGVTFQLLVMRWSSATYTVEYADCSAQKCTPGSQYSSSINSLLTSLEGAAASSSSSSLNQSVGAAHGVFQCSPDCADCPGCVSACVAQLGASCPSSLSGAVRMREGCYVRYDNASFMGVEDKTVVVSKCGGQQLSGGDVAPRDAVLGYLEKGSRMYRKGGEGDVTGVAECVTGLTQGQCQDCLEGAIGLLSTACSYAVSGDVYLASCYARYSAVVTSQPTYNPALPPPNPNPNYTNTDAKSVLGMQKTLAIIIGIIAIVGVIVIVFFLLRKFAKGDDDGCDHACNHK